MQTILIAEESEVFAKSLAEALQDQYRVHICTRGDTALELLESFHPDILIIGLILPYLDGLSVLKAVKQKPQFILALSAVPSGFAIQSARDAGAQNVILLPCTTGAVLGQLEDMLCIDPQLPGPQEIIGDCLQELDFPPRRKGTKQIRVGVPLFSQDEEQLLMEQLYPAIASLCGNDNGRQVESTIRHVIKDTWTNRRNEAWDVYFPGYTHYPTNADFFSTLAKKLK